MRMARVVQENIFHACKHLGVGDHVRPEVVVPEGPRHSQLPHHTAPLHVAPCCLNTRLRACKQAQLSSVAP